MNYIKAVFAFFKTKSLIEDDIKEIKKMDIKSGWKTSEFWGKVATQAVAIWGAVGGLVPPKYAAIIVVSAEGIYTIARTALKIYQTIHGSDATQTTVTTTAPVTTVSTPS